MNCNLSCNKIIKKFKKVWKKIDKSDKIKKRKFGYKKYKGSDNKYGNKKSKATK